MEDMDTCASNHFSDEELFYKEVICGEADLLYLDSYLRDLLRPRQHDEVLG